MAAADRDFAQLLGADELARLRAMLVRLCDA
jgi:hypothetical protein